MSGRAIIVCITKTLFSFTSTSVFTVENKDHCDFVKLRTMLIRCVTYSNSLAMYVQ